MEKEKINEQFKAFCLDKKATTTVIDGYLVAKVPYDKTFDFIYTGNYGDKTLTFSTKLEFFAFYNKETKVCYGNNSYPFYDIPFIFPKNTVIQPIIEEIDREFVEWVNNLNIKDETVDNIAKIWDNVEYWEQYDKDKEARRAIIEGATSETYKPEYRPYRDKFAEIDLTTDQVLRCTTKPAEVIREVVGNLIKKYDTGITVFLYKTLMLQRRIKYYEESKPNKIFDLARLYACLDRDKMQMVTLTIEKEGKQLSFKYPVQTLMYSIDENWLSTYSIPAQDRAEFERLFGRSADFTAKDIVKVQYGKKVLFEL